MKNVCGIERIIGRLVARQIEGLARCRDSLVRSLPRTSLRREWKKSIGVRVPSHERAAEDSRAKRESVDVSAKFSAHFIQAPRLEYIRSRSAAGRNRACLKQGTHIREWAIRCSKTFPGVKHSAADGPKLVRIAIVEADVSIFNFHEVFRRKRQFRHRAEVLSPRARERIRRKFHKAECVCCDAR